MRFRRLILYLSTIIGLLCLCSLFTIQSSTNQLNFSQQFGQLELLATFGRGCPDLKDVRKHLKLPPTIHFAKRTIWLTAVDALIPQSVVKVEQKLIPNFEIVNINDGRCALPDDSLEAESDQITIEFLDEPAMLRNDTSTLLVGLSTTAHNLEAVLPQLTRWQAGSNASLVVSVTESRHAKDLEKLEKRVKLAGIDAKLIRGELLSSPRDAQGHISTLEVLHKYRKPHHKWFALIEDDTFIASVPALMEALEPYNPGKLWYLGALSEDWNLVSGANGFMPSSGAGVILSGPLLDKVCQNLDSCSKVKLVGKTSYRNCVFSRTSPHVSLTQLKGLHQLDFSGDVSGWYESGVSPVLSLHNYNGRHQYPVESAHLVSDSCGNDCFLQRYQFADDVVLTNGYSVVQYPNGLSKLDLDRVEGTFPNIEGQFDFSLGRLRPKLSESDKASWRLEYANKELDGSVRQFYVKRKAHGKNDEDRLRSEIESVFELEWKR